VSVGVYAGALTPPDTSFTVVNVTDSDSANSLFQAIASPLKADCAPFDHGANSSQPVSLAGTEAQCIGGYSWGQEANDTPMPLTDVTIRRAEPGEKPYKLADSGGLYLFVSPTGAKSFRWKYRVDGREKVLTFGLYPEVKLAEARDKRDEARRQLRDGIDPGARREAAATFETLARAWHKREASRWAARHSADVLGSLEAEVFPALGALPVDRISIRDVRRCLGVIEDRGAIETAHRVRQRMDAVFRYAIASGETENNPAASVKDALARKAPVKPQPALVDLDAARRMLADALACPAQPVTRTALLTMALTAARPGEVRGMMWRELDLDAALWGIPAARMKMRADHIIPLPAVLVAALRELQALTGSGPLVFPSIRDASQPMSENAVGYLLNRAGYHGRQSAHGFRATFSSIMNERFPADRAVIDLMLAHKPAGVSASEGSYNRAAHMQRRRELADAWAELIAPRATALLTGERG
jgi:integrase